MKLLLAFCLGLLPVASFGQSQLTGKVVYPRGNSLAIMLASPANKGAEAARLADLDIAAGHLLLFLQSGIAPAVYLGDSAFCRKYKVAYWEEGCSGPGLVSMQAYNARVFAHLQQVHGNAWGKSIRKDVIGFKHWKKERRRPF